MTSTDQAQLLEELDRWPLEAVATLRRQLDALIYARVQAGRDAGLTWRELAAQLHVSYQEAHRRYRRPQYELTDGPAHIRAHARDSSLE